MSASRNLKRGPYVRWDDAMDDELRQLWQSGATGTEIGRVLDVSRYAAIARANRLRLPSRVSPLSMSQRA